MWQTERQTNGQIAVAHTEHVRAAKITASVCFPIAFQLYDVHAVISRVFGVRKVAITVSVSCTVTILKITPILSRAWLPARTCNVEQFFTVSIMTVKMIACVYAFLFVCTHILTNICYVSRHWIKKIMFEIAETIFKLTQGRWHWSKSMDHIVGKEG